MHFEQNVEFFFDVSAIHNFLTSGQKNFRIFSQTVFLSKFLVQLF